MKIKDLINVIFDDVIIYKSKDEDFGEYEDFYKGDKDSIPSLLLEKKVKSVGAKRKGIVDIEIF